MKLPVRMAIQTELEKVLLKSFVEGKDVFTSLVFMLRPATIDFQHQERSDEKDIHLLDSVSLSSIDERPVLLFHSALKGISAAFVMSRKPHPSRLGIANVNVSR